MAVYPPTVLDPSLQSMANRILPPRKDIARREPDQPSVERNMVVEVSSAEDCYIRSFTACNSAFNGSLRYRCIRRNSVEAPIRYAHVPSSYGTVEEIVGRDLCQT